MYVITFTEDVERGYYAYCRSYNTILDIPFPINRSYQSGEHSIRQHLEFFGDYVGPMQERYVIIRRE